MGCLCDPGRQPDSPCVLSPTAVEETLARNRAPSGSPPQERVKKVRSTRFTVFFTKFFTLWRSKFFTKRGMQVSGRRNMPWKKHQIGRERPHFFGSRPPK
jgi:hypothetical protein